MIIRFSIVLATIVTLTSFVSAQDSKVSFTAMLWEGEKQEFFYREKEQPKSIQIRKGQRSVAHVLSNSAEFLLYTKTQSKEPDVAPVFTLVAKTTIPLNAKKMLFMLFKNDKETSDQLEYKVLALDDSEKGFPRGTFRFINLNDEELTVSFARKEQRLKGNGITLMKSNVDDNSGMIPFLVLNQTGKIVYQTRLWAQSDGRELVFIGPPRKVGGLPQLRFMSQFLPRKIE